MSNVDRIGTFRFDKVLSVSLNVGKDVSEDDPRPTYIKFVALLHLSEFWDAETSEWVDWMDADVETAAYLTLNFFSKKSKEIEDFSLCEKVKEVFGWDGGSYKVLCTSDYGEVKGQVRFEDETYDKAKVPFKVVWLDTYDATPGRQLRQITGDDLDKVDKLMASHLQKSSKPAKAVSAKRKGNGKSGSVAARTALDGKKPPKAPKAPKTTAAVGTCTSDDAYQACFNLKRDDVTKERLDELWVKMVGQVDEDEAKITEEQWYEIKEKLLKVTAKV